MHGNVFQALSEFYAEHRDELDTGKVADVGALNLNGSAKDVIKHCVGFDIVAGPGVDVVITPGQIPEEHKHQYGGVVSVSSFQFCPDANIYKTQIVDLLGKRGLLFLTMCSPKCRVLHSTSNNQYGFTDSFRAEPAAVGAFFKEEFDLLQLREVENDHCDIVLVARRRV